MKRAVRQEIVYEAIERKGGASPIVEMAQQFRGKHEADLKASDDLFCTWQYEMRWAAQRLRD